MNNILKNLTKKTVKNNNIIERNTFKKDERLYGTIALNNLFYNGFTIFNYPFKLIYIEPKEIQKYPIRIVFSIPKKNIRKACLRNKIRRKLKEIYRLNKNIYYKNLLSINKNIKLHIALVYLENKILDYKYLDEKLNETFKKLIIDIEKTYS